MFIYQRVMHRDLITNSSLGIHRGRDWWIFKLLHRVAPLLAMEKVLVRNEATYGKMVINVAIEDGGRMDNCEIMGIIMAYIYNQENDMGMSENGSLGPNKISFNMFPWER